MYIDEATKIKNGYNWPGNYYDFQHLYNDDDWGMYFFAKMTLEDGTDYFLEQYHEYIPPVNNHYYPNINAYENLHIIEENLSVLFDFLSKHHPDYLFPFSARTKEGKTMMILDEKTQNRPSDIYCIAFPAIPDSYTLKIKNDVNHINDVKNYKFSKNEVFEAATAFGKFGSVTSDMESNDLKISKKELYDPIAAHDHLKYTLKYTARKEFVQELKNELKVIEQKKNIIRRYQTFIKHPEAKLRVVHNQAKVLNTIFDKDGKGMYILGFNYVMPGYFLNDLGSLYRNAACYRNEKSKLEFSSELMNAVTDGYLTHMKNHLTPWEISNLHFAGEVVMYTNAIRRIADCLDETIHIHNNLHVIQNELAFLQMFQEATH